MQKQTEFYETQLKKHIKTVYKNYISNLIF
jgi:hypothetical protein